MDSDPPKVPVVRVGDSDPRLLAVVLLAALLVAFAVAKPWTPPPLVGPVGSPSVSPEATSPGVSTTPAASPSGQRAPADWATAQCYSPDGWRLFTVERLGLQQTRNWTRIEPVGASGPTDPTIPTVYVITERVLALGYCAPVLGMQRPSATYIVAGWALPVDAPAQPIDLLNAGPAVPNQNAGGALYRPPASPEAEARDRWAPGRYVFEIRDTASGGVDRWFGVSVVAVAGTALATDAGGPFVR